MGDEHTDAIGLWQLRETQSIADDGSGRQPNDVYIFRYDGDTVTLRMMTLQAGVWKSDDDFYRLDARWNGSMLEYRPPFADWAELASFEGDHFEDAGSGTRRVFTRIGSRRLERRDPQAARAPRLLGAARGRAGAPGLSWGWIAPRRAVTEPAKGTQCVR